VSEVSETLKINSDAVQRAKTLLEDINILAGARRCYASDEDHDAALLDLVVQALQHEARIGG
jgi:hypothetical protein